MLYCEMYSFLQYKPHPHAEHFANRVYWYALGKPGSNSDFKQKINTGGIFCFLVAMSSPESHCLFFFFYSIEVV